MNYPDIGFRKAVINNGRLLTDPLPKIQDGSGTTEGIEEQIEQAQKKLDRLKQQATKQQDYIREQAERDRIAARISDELALAEATQTLLTHIHQLVVDQTRSVNGSKALAYFIKELQPLAQTYGVKIVKVGNGELATLVLASAK